MGGELFAILAAIAVTILWWWSLKARELVNSISRWTCEDLGLQRLDDSVRLRRLWLQRDVDGRLVLCRVYAFEYTASGAERELGDVCLEGRCPAWVHLRLDDREVHLDLSKRKPTPLRLGQ